MNLAITVLAFIVALGVLIVFHEFGHYLVARLFGVKVLRFSIGFGRALWRTRRGRDRTEWVIAALPLGGYVKMLDEHEGPVAPEEVHRAFNRQSVWRRIVIVAAGPAANFLLAIVFYWALFVGGVQEAKPVVGAPDPGTVAEASGLERGETILKINEEPVASWQQVRWRLLQLAVEKQPARLEVIDPKQRLTWRTLDLSGFDLEGFDSDPLARLGLRLDRPDVAPIIGKVVPGSVAEAGGLRPGDRVVSIDGGEIQVWEDVVKAVRRRPGEIVRLGIVRGGKQIEVRLRPETVQQNGERIGRIGTAPQVDAESMNSLITTVRYAPAAALGMALARTWETSVFSLKMLGKMVIGQISWKNLSGPVTIADYAGQSAQLGIGAYIAFLALISISLGVLNLLPIPLLDGGHLLYYVVEIFKGSPVSERAMELGQRLGLTLLLFLMAFAIYNDFNRLFAG
ncbi:MAG TPA: RIP metalloprotease RseP [Burkholderiales bacterium]|nr:RIP metalloprotease RseP [Burkholderiales bacterium]